MAYLCSNIMNWAWEKQIAKFNVTFCSFQYVSLSATLTADIAIAIISTVQICIIYKFSIRHSILLGNIGSCSWILYKLFLFAARGPCCWDTVQTSAKEEHYWTETTSEVSSAFLWFWFFKRNGIMSNKQSFVKVFLSRRFHLGEHEIWIAWCFCEL